MAKDSPRKGRASTPEEIRLSKSIKKGSRVAREELLAKNMGLVWNYVMRFRGSCAGCYYDDLAQEARIGLWEATEKFDSKKGSFSNWAKWFMKKRVLTFLSCHTRTVRHPSGFLRKIIKLENHVGQGDVADLSDKEIKEVLGYKKTDERQHLYYMTFLRRGVLTPVCSGTDDEDSPLDVFAQLKYSGEGQSSNLENSGYQRTDLVEKMMEVVLGFMGNMSESDRSVLIRRFGLNGQEKETLNQIGRELKLTREAVRLREKKALKKLRNSLKLMLIHEERGTVGTVRELNVICSEFVGSEPVSILD